MTKRCILRVLSMLLLTLSFGTAAFASIPAVNRFAEGVAAVQGVWYDLDGNEAFSVAGTAFDGRTIRSVTSYGVSAEACNADFGLEGENGENLSYINITWTADRRFLLLNSRYYRSTKEPLYFESVQGVFLGMKTEDALTLLGEPAGHTKNGRFIYPGMTINTSGGMVIAIFLPSGGARLDGSGLGADDTPEDFAAAYGFPEGWDGQNSMEIGNCKEYLQRKDGRIILSLFKK